MGIETKLVMKQSQRLVMTQMLQQAIKLLPMARMELVQMIQKSMEENPLLEESSIMEDEGEGENGNGEVTTAESEKTLLKNEGMTSDVEKYTDDIETPRQDPEIDFESFYQENFDQGSYFEDYTEKPSIEGTLKSTNSLSDNLHLQLGSATDNHREKMLGYYIIGNLNSEGYLQAELEEIVEECKASLEEVEEAVKMIQGFDPPGIAARSLKECLLIQLRQKNLDSGLAEAIVTNHLAFLQENRLDKIAKALEIEVDEVIKAVKVLKELDPKPGHRFTENDTQYIIPDVYVVKEEDGEYKVIMNDEGVPSLRVNPYYKNLLDKEKGNKTKSSTRDFMEEKFRSAVWLIKSIEQRRQTIYKTATSLVKFQKDFLDMGFAYLKPLILRDVANDISMHESTISRVTTNKYIHTPRGIFELKFFFHSGLGTFLGSSNMSSYHVKKLIRQTIEEEDCNKPVTDEEIVEVLSKKNIKIARRTIAKYRKEMRISAAGQRRRVYEQNR